MSAASPKALPRRIATSGPRRSATAPQARNDSVVAAAVRIPMMPDVRERQVQPVDVDDARTAAPRRSGRRRRSPGRAAIRDRTGRSRSARNESRAEKSRRSARCRASEGRCRRSRRPDPTQPGERDRGLATDLVGEDAARERCERGRRGPAGAQEADDPTEDPGRIHRPPQPQVERAAEREAQPEDDRHRDHHRAPTAKTASRSSDAGPGGPDERELPPRSRTDASGERPEQVRDERRGGEGGQTDRVEAAAAGDGRQERRDQRDRDARPRPTRP